MTWVLRRTLTTKLLLGGAVLLVMLSVIGVVITTIVSAVATPVAAVDRATSWLFGDDDTGGNGSPADADTTRRLQQCLTVSVSALDSVIAELPPGTAADLAHGWVLYRLAHQSGTTGPYSSATAVPPERGQAPRSTADGTAALSFDQFARRWDLATTSSATTTASSTQASTSTDDPPYPMTDGVPSTLIRLDPATDYRPVHIDALVAMVQLEKTGRITLGEDQRALIARQITADCFSPSAAATGGAAAPSTPPWPQN